MICVVEAICLSIRKGSIPPQLLEKAVTPKEERNLKVLRREGILKLLRGKGILNEFLCGEWNLKFPYLILPLGRQKYCKERQGSKKVDNNDYFCIKINYDNHDIDVNYS